MTDKEKIALLLSALKWYIETDETNLEDPSNQFYIDGYNRAVETIALVEK